MIESASSPSCGGHDFGEVDPVGGLRRLIRSALLEEQDVDDDVGSGRRAHGAFGQADRADEIGHGGEKHAGRRIGLVQGPAARDEGRESAGHEPLDRPRNEIIMERQAEPAGWIVGADGAGAERRVTDNEVVSLGDARLGEVLGADARVRIEEFCNPRRDRVHFDAGQRRLGLERFRHEGEKEAGPAPGLEDATAGEAHTPQGAPDSAHHEFRGEMRVLRDAGEARELGRRDQLLEVFPEGFPALWEGFLGRSAEEVVGEFARAEGREEGETVLLFRSRVPRPLLDLKHESDGGDVVRRARLPVGGEAASARETEVARRNDDRRGGVFLRLGDRVVDRLAEGEAGIEAHRGGEGGRVEERQAQLVGGRLHCDGNLSGARDRPAGARGAAGIGLMGIEGRGGRAEARRSVRRLSASSELRRLLIVRRVGIVFAGGVRRMVGEDPFGDPIGVGRGAEDLALVVLEDLDPGLNVACVVGDVAGQPERISHEISWKSRLGVLPANRRCRRSGR